MRRWQRAAAANERSGACATTSGTRTSNVTPMYELVRPVGASSSPSAAMGVPDAAMAEPQRWSPRGPRARPPALKRHQQACAQHQSTVWVQRISRGIARRARPLAAFSSGCSRTRSRAEAIFSPSCRPAAGFYCLAALKQRDARGSGDGFAADARLAVVWRSSPASSVGGHFCGRSRAWDAPRAAGGAPIDYIPFGKHSIPVNLHINGSIGPWRRKMVPRWPAYHFPPQLDDFGRVEPPQHDNSLASDYSRGVCRGGAACTDTLRAAAAATGSSGPATQRVVTGGAGGGGGDGAVR